MRKTLIAALILFGTSCITPAQATNDECTAAIPVFFGVNPGAPGGTPGNTFSFAGATLSPGPAFCATVTQGDVWFTYTPTMTGNITITTCDFGWPSTATNTVIQVLTNDCPATTATVLGCNDDFCGLRSWVVVPLVIFTPVLIRVAPVGTSVAGTFYLKIETPQINDECTQPVPVLDGINPGPPAGAQGSTYTFIGATPSAAPATCGPPLVADLWFRYTATATGTYAFSTCAPNGWNVPKPADTVIDVRVNQCPAGASLACNDNGCGAFSEVQVPVVAGTAYLIRVSSVSAVYAGAFHLRIAPIPGNDDCSAPIPVVVGTNGPFDNTHASNSGMTASCGASSSPGYKDVFFEFTPTCSGTYRIDTDSAPYLNTLLSVFDACGGTELACDDDGGTGASSMIPSIALVGGAPYLIRVASSNASQSGIFHVNVSNSPAAVVWSSPFGPGTIQYQVKTGPPSGSYLHAIDFSGGMFPNGWFFGIDIAGEQLLAQILAGYPFVGALDACGGATLGPVGGAPSGIALYSVAILATGPGLSGVISVTPPVSYVIP